MHSFYGLSRGKNKSWGWLYTWLMKYSALVLVVKSRCVELVLFKGVGKTIDELFIKIHSSWYASIRLQDHQIIQSSHPSFVCIWSYLINLRTDFTEGAESRNIHFVLIETNIDCFELLLVCINILYLLLIYPTNVTPITFTLYQLCFCWLLQLLFNNILYIL